MFSNLLNSILLPLTAQCFVTPLKSLCFSRNSRKFIPVPILLRYIEWLANAWLLHRNLRVTFGSQKHLLQLQLYSLSSALHSKENYSEEEIKIVSRFFFCSLCEISSVRTSPAMHISSSAQQYCSALELGSSFNWELLVKCNVTEEVMIPTSTRR